MKALKPLLKSLVKGHNVKFENSEFSTFDSALGKFEEYRSLTSFEKTLLHEYYLEKLRQKEREAEAEAARKKQDSIDECQYRLKK